MPNAGSDLSKNRETGPKQMAKLLVSFFACILLVSGFDLQALYEDGFCGGDVISNWAKR